MAKSISVITKKRGRPKTTGTGQIVGVRLQPEQLTAIDRALTLQKEPKPSRPEMIRRMITDWLRERGYLPKGPSDG